MKNKQKNFYFFIGTPAELIKVSPIIVKFNQKKVNYKIINSGQSEISFSELEYLIGQQKVFSFKPKSKESSIIKFAFWAFKALISSFFLLKKEFKDKQNTCIIIQGDTITALLGAVVAKVYNLKLAHIESGVRSFNFLEPFPEEATRSLISLLADVHFCPNAWAANNIKSLPGVKVNTFQNTAYEVLLSALKRKTPIKSIKLSAKSKFFLLIIHRQEHMLYKKQITKAYIDQLTSFANPNLKCVFITHRLTKDFLEAQNLLNKIKKNPNVIFSPRLPFSEFVQVLSKAEFIASDGGGNQPESYYLGKPCLILRKFTEQTEGISSNATLAKDDLSIVKRFLKNYKSQNRLPVVAKKLPSDIIVDYLINN